MSPFSRVQDLLLLAIVSQSQSGMLHQPSLSAFAEMLGCSNAAIADALEELFDGEWLQWVPSGKDLEICPRAVQWVWMQIADTTDRNQPLPSVEQVAEYLLIQRLHLAPVST